MLRSGAAVEPAVTGWGSPALRRATLTLAVAQLVSWGVLFYGFAVASVAIGEDTGWSEGTLSGAFALGLLVAGLGAPLVADALGRHDPRHVLTAGSVVGMAGMTVFATARTPLALYAGWSVIGLAMAVTLYEPAMAVLVVLDPARRHRTLTAVTVAGGLASTVFAPLGAWLVEMYGWRSALALMGVSGGAFTAALHWVGLPARGEHTVIAPVAHRPSPRCDRRLRRLRAAVILEQAAAVATTASLVALLVDAGVAMVTAAGALAVMGVGKVAGRLLLLGPVGRRPLAPLSAAATLAQLAGMAVPLASTARPALYASMVLVGAASGTTTVLRPLLVVDLAGPAPFAATNAGIQRASTFARAAAPLVLGTAVATIGWPIAWACCLVTFAIAAERYLAVGRPRSGGARPEGHDVAAAA